MKKSLLMVIAIAFYCFIVASHVFAQPVWVGDYIITDAADIAALSGYTEVTGTLRIGFSSNPEEMSPAQSPTTFESLSGLESLTRVGEDLDIRYNGSLISLAGLENLTSVGYRLS